MKVIYPDGNVLTASIVGNKDASPELQNGDFNNSLPQSSNAISPSNLLDCTPKNST